MSEDEESESDEGNQSTAKMTADEFVLEAIDAFFADF